MPPVEYDKRVLEVLAKASDLAAEAARLQLDATFGVAVTHTSMTPIEQLFYAAFIGDRAGDTDYKIVPQYSVGNYRVDFLVTFTPGTEPTVRVVVECDGHDFHEKTKEQAE